MRTRLMVVVVVLLSMVSLAPLAMAAAPSESAVPAGDVSMVVAGLCATPEVTALVEVGEIAEFDGDVIPAEPEPVCAATACATTAAAAGDPLCAQGGTKCKDPGAKCKRTNGCGTCHHVITGDATGERCRGCTCF